MRTTCPERPSGARCRGLWSAALTIALAAASTHAAAGEPRTPADDEAEARELSRQGAHALAGERWTAVAASAETAKARILGAFRGYQAWLAAYNDDRDEAHLLAARSLMIELIAMIEREHLGDALRLDAEARLASVDAMLAATPAESDPPVLMSVRRSSRPWPAPADPVVDAPRPAIPPRARALTLAGSVGLGLGVSLLGVMVSGLVVDARSAAAILEYKDLRDSGDLSDADWQRIDDLGAAGLRGARLAKIAGIAGGVVMITSAALLGRGLHLRQRSIALYPDIDQAHAGLGLRGRF